MAGKAKNQELGPQGGTVTLDVFIFQFSGGPAIDPDGQIINFEIFDPSNVSIATGVGTRTGVGQYNTTYTIPLTAVISDTWKITWTGTINGGTIVSSEFFRVIAPSSISFGGQSNILITDEWYNLIIKVIGFPDVDRVLLDRIQVINLCLWPAMQYYYQKFPRKLREQFNVGTNATLVKPFPDQFTYGVTDVRVVGKGNQTGSSGGGFWDLILYNKYYGYNNYGSYGQNGYRNSYNPNGLRQQSYAYKYELDTIANRSTSKYRVNHEDRQLEVYTSISAEVSVTWASFGTDFEDVKYARRMDVISLAQAEVLDHLADTSGLIVDNTSEITINSDTLRGRAEELRNKILEKWAEWPDVIVLRGDGFV